MSEVKLLALYLTILSGFGHFFVYDPKTLAIAMTAVGFTEPKLAEISRSEHQGLTDIESHGQVVGAELNEFETMVMEARKT